MPPKKAVPPQESARGKTKTPAALAAGAKKKAEAAASKPQRATLVKSLAMRTDCAVESEKAGDLPAGTAIWVLKVEEAAPGVKRAQVAMAENGPPLGWVTAAKDKAENFIYEPAMSSRGEKAGGQATTATTTTTPAKGASKAADKAVASGPDGELITFLLARAGLSHAEAAEAAAASTKAKAKAAAAAAEAAAKPAEPKVPVRARTGNFLAGTASGAARRNKKVRAARAADSENSAVAENVEDFDWASSGGGWTIEKWLSSLQLHVLVAAAIDARPTAEGEEAAVERSTAYEHTKALSREDIATRLGKPEVIDGLIDAIHQGVSELQSQVAATGADLNVKFHLEGGQYEMAFGSLELFYGGLDNLIGPPQMINGSIVKAMEADHCNHNDATVRAWLTPTASLACTLRMRRLLTSHLSPALSACAVCSPHLALST